MSNRHLIRMLHRLGMKHDRCGLRGRYQPLLEMLEDRMAPSATLSVMPPSIAMSLIDTPDVPAVMGSATAGSQPGTDAAPYSTAIITTPPQAPASNGTSSPSSSVNSPPNQTNLADKTYVEFEQRVANQMKQPSASPVIAPLPSAAVPPVRTAPFVGQIIGATSPLSWPPSSGSADEGALGGMVVRDLDEFGSQLEDRPGVGGVTVALDVRTSNGWSEVARTVTAADGSYNFSVIVAGSYRVRLVLGPNDEVNHVDGPTEIAVPATTSVNGTVFGLRSSRAPIQMDDEPVGADGSGVTISSDDGPVEIPLLQ
jgi:hypothetical protein